MFAKSLGTVKFWNIKVASFKTLNPDNLRVNLKMDANEFWWTVRSLFLYILIFLILTKWRHSNNAMFPPCRKWVTSRDQALESQTLFFPCQSQKSVSQTLNLRLRIKLAKISKSSNGLICKKIIFGTFSEFWPEIYEDLRS